jgi:5'-nucleotidase
VSCLNSSFVFSEVELEYREWIGTVSSWPPSFEYRDMEAVGKDLSRRLRDPKGEYKCDLIIALTHSRYVYYSFQDIGV